MAKTDYTREELIKLCQRAIVPQDDWANRDSAGAQRKAGEAWTLLRAGCVFRVLTEGKYCVTDDETIWIEIDFQGFDYFEGGVTGTETFYLPTPARLRKVKRGDWY